MERPAFASRAGASCWAPCPSKSAPLLSTLALLLCATAAAGAATPAPALVLSDLTVIDGNGGVPLEHTTIVVTGDRIADLYPTGSKPQPADARTIDLHGRWAIPGLIDSHVHVATDPGGRDSLARDRLQDAFFGGVTTVRDMAGDGVVLAELANWAASASVPSPRIHFAALMAGESFFKDPRTRSSAHGLTPGQAPWQRAIRLETDVRAVVADAKATGAAGIKIYADLAPPHIARVASEGHRQGLKIWSHATVFPARPGDAVDAGVDVLSHAILLYWEGAATVPATYHDRGAAAADYSAVPVSSAAITTLLEQMKARGTILDATLYISRRLASAPAGTAGLFDPARAVQWMYDVTRRAKELGVVVAAGTDGMSPGGAGEPPNLHAEMEILVTKAGFTPLEAIGAATLNGARALGKERELGTIARGRIADLVVLGANPAENIRNTRQVELVIKAGRVHQVSRSAPREP